MRNNRQQRTPCFAQFVFPPKKKKNNARQKKTTCFVLLTFFLGRTSTCGLIFLFQSRSKNAEKSRKCLQRRSRRCYSPQHSVSSDRMCAYCHSRHPFLVRHAYSSRHSCRRGSRKGVSLHEKTHFHDQSHGKSLSKTFLFEEKLTLSIGMGQVREGDCHLQPFLGQTTWVA